MAEVNAPVVDAEVNAPAVNAEVNAPVVETLMKMNEGVPERSGLDPETYMLVRIAALASTGAPPASYLLNLEVAAEVGLTVESADVRVVRVWRRNRAPRKIPQRWLSPR